MGNERAQLTPLQNARCHAAGLAGCYQAGVPYCDDTDVITEANKLIQQAVDMIEKAGVREHVPQAPGHARHATHESAQTLLGKKSS